MHVTPIVSSEPSSVCSSQLTVIISNSFARLSQATPFAGNERRHMRAHTFFVLVLLTCTCMPRTQKRKRPASAQEQPGNVDKQQLLRTLVENGTKTGVAQTLHQLHVAGLLPEQLAGKNDRIIRGDLAKAQDTHGQQKTPYGTVIQEMELPIGCQWEIAHPMAYMYYLTSISSDFAQGMVHAVQVKGSLTIVLYMDEICPGNPNRPEKSRTLQAIYWAFLEWPQYILQRTGAWPIFGVLRSRIVEKFPGAMGELMKHILKLFFNTDGHSFEKGVCINIGERALMVKATFGAFLADEKALKEVSSTKGQAGLKPCPSCSRVHKKSITLAAMERHGLVPTDSTDTSQFNDMTDEDVFEIADHLTAIAENTPDLLDKRSTELGFNYSPESLLYDKDLRDRGVYKPITNLFRDWMHVLMSSGLANTHAYALINALKANGFDVKLLQEYMSHFNLPSKHGKLNVVWVAPSRMRRKTHHLASFSGIMLSVLPLILCFLEDCVAPTGRMQEEIECWTALCSIVGLLSLGPDDAMSWIDTIRRLIMSHAEQYKRLYGPKACKFKFHMVFHLVDDFMRFGKALSCFVTERKHRFTKKSALFVFRYIEKTVLKSMVNKQCNEFAGETSSLFLSSYLVNPRSISIGNLPLVYARSANCRCGIIRIGDFVYLHSGQVGKLVAFWCDSSATIVAQVDIFTKCDGRGMYSVARPSTSFVSIEDIADALIWCRREGGRVRVHLPVKTRF